MKPNIPKVTEFTIIRRNLINKYNNSLYETYDSEDDELMVSIEMYNAS